MGGPGRGRCIFAEEAGDGLGAVVAAGDGELVEVPYPLPGKGVAAAAALDLAAEQEQPGTALLIGGSAAGTACTLHLAAVGVYD
ncbi:hypothetical protein [Streptomyces sp. NPDC001165]|uniref:hypothetical protein n=1 Tax=Streptomyces sp. NPDC001165 TaxID=3364546 RepID=UPI0036ADB0A9